MSSRNISRNKIYAQEANEALCEFALRTFRDLSTYTEYGGTVRDYGHKWEAAGIIFHD